MPTLPLYLPNPGHPDASHRVTAPGGYEWWHIDGESDAGDVRFVAALYDGYPFHPDYLRHYSRYLRAPTRRAPPVPADYPRVEFVLYENGRPARELVSDFPRGSAVGDTCRPDVRVGPHGFERLGDGSLHLRLEGGALAAELIFRPLLPHRPLEQVLLVHAPESAEHHRIISDPLCSAEGSVALDDRSRVVQFTGRAYHDHHYGTAPPAATWRSWIRGRALIGDAVYAFDHAVRRGRSLHTVTRVVIADAAGVREVPTERVAFREVASSISFGGELALSNPRRLDGRDWPRRVLYDAAAHAGAAGTALVEITP